MKTISIPTNNRPALLHRCLESLRNAVGIADWTLVFSCEPNQTVCDMVTKISWAPVYFSRNPVQFGCWDNTFRAAELAMAVGSEVNLYIEDDLVVSPDVLILADQWRKTSYPILALRRPDETRRPEPTKVANFPGGLFGDGFAWRRNEWPLVRAAWFAAGYSMWDWAMEGELKKRHMTQARPLIHRSQNIGIEGTHQHGYDPNRHSACYPGPIVVRFDFS